MAYLLLSPYPCNPRTAQAGSGAAELPGLRADDIELDLENNVLTISGEKREERTEGDERGSYHLSERRFGKFSRSFVLPRDVEAGQIRASFENGVLSVTIPKSDKARRRRIEVQGGGSASRGSERPASTPQNR